MHQLMRRADALQADAARIPAPRQADPDSIDLRALGRLLLRRWKTILGLSLLAAGAVYLLLSLSAPVYSSTAKVLVDPRRTEVLSGSDVIATREPSQQVINSEIAILTSNVLIEDVIRELGFDRLAPLDPSPEGATEAQRLEGLVWAIRRNLAVWSEADSYVIALSFSAGDPALAMDVSNTLADRYLALQVQNRRETIGQAAGWLEEQLGALQSRIAENEETIAQMRTESVLEHGSTLENATQQITTLNNQLVAARAERVAAEAQLQQLDGLLETGGVAGAAAAVSSPALEALRDQARALRQQDAAWAETVGPDHPRRAPILADLEQVEANILAEARNVIDLRRGDYDVAQLRERSLEENLAAMEERVVEISRSEIGLRQLERETETARRTHEAMLGRLTETRTQERVQRAEAKLIERATLPAGPTAPRPKLMAAVAGASVFGIAVLALFFAEMTVTTFRSAREVEAETGLPVLTALPLVPQKQGQSVFDRFQSEPYSPYAERIRQLRTMLLMRDEGVISTSVAVLSSNHGEGRTTTALALAEMAVRAQRPTIIVDCDLRGTTLRQGFGWELEHDFADYLTGKCSLGQAIHSPQDLQFDVLTCARPRLDLADELSTLWLRPIIDQLKDIYEVIIIDGPPLLAVSDAVIASKVADKRIYVVEHDRTQKSRLRDGLAMLADFQLPVDGMVLNKVKGREAEETHHG